MTARGPLEPAVGAERYHDEVAARLRAAASREEAVEILDQIKSELATQAYPVRVFVPQHRRSAEVVTAEGEHSRRIRSIDGAEVSSEWIPPTVAIAGEDDRGNALRRSAMPWQSASTPVLRAEARAVVAELPGDFEFLPVVCDSADLWILNATRVLDGAIDESTSELVRLSSGKVVAIRRPVFRADVVRDVPIFRLAQQPRYSIYVDERWATALSVLDNVAFDLVWSSVAAARRHSVARPPMARTRPGIGGKAH